MVIVALSCINRLMDTYANEIDDVKPTKRGGTERQRSEARYISEALQPRMRTRTRLSDQPYQMMRGIIALELSLLPQHSMNSKCHVKEITPLKS